MLDPQNFTVYAENRTVISINIDPDDDITLVGAVITWCVYEQELGQPVANASPVLTKTNGDGGTVVVTDPDAQILEIPLEAADTAGLLRNYYHECTVQDPDRGEITVAQGIMTVLGTENRPATT
jgi:hypothetical protein